MILTNLISVGSFLAVVFSEASEALFKDNLKQNRYQAINDIKPNNDSFLGMNFYCFLVPIHFI